MQCQDAAGGMDNVVGAEGGMDNVVGAEGGMGSVVDAARVMEIEVDAEPKWLGYVALSELDTLDELHEDLQEDEDVHVHEELMLVGHGLVLPREEQHGIGGCTSELIKRLIRLLSVLQLKKIVLFSMLNSSASSTKPENGWKSIFFKATQDISVCIY